MVLQTCASDGGLKTFFCRLGLGISPAGIVADAISAMAAVFSQLFENRSAALGWQRLCEVDALGGFGRLPVV